MNFIQKELSHFLSLSQKARDLLVSYLYFGTTYTLIGTFMNAFIWRKQGDIVSLAFYNIGETTMLPLIFYFNGYLLKKFKITHLYFFGAILTALIPITIVFFPTTTALSYLVFGLLFGVGYGMYWANRNYLTYKETTSHNRDYFLGLNFSFNTLTGVFIPLIIGWFIYFVPFKGYQISMLFAFVLLLLAGLKIVKDEHRSPEISHVVITKTTARWWKIRGLVTSIGLIEGISLFFPTLLILTKLGAENVLGSFSSFLYLVSACLIYYYGRKAKVHHQKPVLLITVLSGLVATIIFGWFFNSWATVIYLAVNYLTIEFMWLTAGPITMNIMDEEKLTAGHNIYALIFDQELFLDLGRMISFGVLFVIIACFGQQAALRFSPVFVYLLQLMLLIRLKE